MKTTDWMSSGGAWMLEHGHKTLLALTGGRWPKTIGGMTTVDLTTIGRKSGQPRTKPLTTPIHDDQRIVLVASKGGHSDHPDWYKNLVANPDVEITLDGETTKMRARTATGEERAELWAQIVAKQKTYAGYQRNTEREIPVVICEPIS
ncbi:MAG: nitroreductase family deazaflavin-dependent oxidoreductase [Actinomycetota bacterium]|nr:nitroreductase family deazaflavin-dependent oxidoreductase [Actinomycetota bacterium]